MRKIYFSKRSKSMSLTIGDKAFRASFEGGSTYSGICIPHQFITENEAVQKAIEGREDFKNGAVWCEVLVSDTKDQKNETPIVPANDNGNPPAEPTVITDVTNGQQARKLLIDFLEGKETVAPGSNNSVLIGLSDKYNVQFPNWEAWKTAHNVEE